MAGVRSGLGLGLGLGGVVVGRLVGGWWAGASPRQAMVWRVPDRFGG